MKRTFKATIINSNGEKITYKIDPITRTKINDIDNNDYKIADGEIVNYETKEIPNSHIRGDMTSSIPSVLTYYYIEYFNEYKEKMCTLKTYDVDFKITNLKDPFVRIKYDKNDNGKIIQYNKRKITDFSKLKFRDNDNIFPKAKLEIFKFIFLIIIVVFMLIVIATMF